MAFYTPNPLILWTLNSTTMEITQEYKAFPVSRLMKCGGTQKGGILWLAGGQVFPSVRELSFCPLKLWCSFHGAFVHTTKWRERNKEIVWDTGRQCRFPEPAARGPLIKSACGPGLPDSHRGVWQSHYGVCSFTDTAETVFHWEDSSC